MGEKKAVKGWIHSESYRQQQRKNKRKKRKLESGRRGNAGRGCCASRVVKGMGALTAQGVRRISRDEVFQCHKEGRKEDKERKTVPNGCVSEGLSIRDGGLQSIEQIGKIE